MLCICRNALYLPKIHISVVAYYVDLSCYQILKMSFIFIILIAEIIVSAEIVSFCR